MLSTKDEVPSTSSKHDDTAPKALKKPSKRKPREKFVIFNVPMLFTEPKLPPIVFHLHEIKDIHGVDVMYPHYQVNAQIKMESSIPLLQDEIRDLDYEATVYDAPVKDLETIWGCMNRFYTDFTKVKQLYYDPCLSNAFLHHRLSSLLGDTIFDRTRNDVGLAGIQNAIQSAHIKTHEFWRPNDVALFMMIRILCNVAKSVPPGSRCNIPTALAWKNSKGNQPARVTEALTKIHEMGVNLDDLLTIATESVFRGLEHRDRSSERFATSYYEAKNVTSEDTVHNDRRRAARVLPHFVGLRNMCVEETLQALDECYKVGMEVKPMEVKSKQPKVETVKVPANFVPECRKQIADGKAFIKSAEAERTALIAKHNDLISKKLYQAVVNKYQKLSIQVYERQMQLSRLTDVKILREQRSYSRKLFQRRCRRIRQDIIELLKIRSEECLPILKRHAEQYAKTAASLNPEYVKEQKVQSEILERKLLHEVAQGHQSVPARQQWFDHVNTVKRCVLKRDNPEVNHIERKKKILEKIKIDEQEAKNFNRHSFIVPCPLPSRLRPPFSKADPSRDKMAAAAPPVSKTLQALAETHRKRVESAPSTSKRVASIAEVLKGDRSASRGARKRPPESAIREKSAEVSSKRPRQTSFDTAAAAVKADISLTEIDELLEESFSEPPKPVPKQLTIQQIHPITRDTRISLRSLMPEQIPLFMRSVLPVKPQRPLCIPPEVQDPSTHTAWMQAHGFDDAHDPPDAPWRKWLNVLTMKHLLRYSIQESRRQLAIQAHTDLRNETVFPEMIPRQIQRSLDDTKHFGAEIAKKQRLTENLVKAKTSTAAECFRMLRNAKEPLQNLHEAEATNLTNFKEKARLENSHVSINEHVQVLQKWNTHLRDYKTACVALRVKNDKINTDVDRLTRTSERQAIVVNDRQKRLEQAIQQKRAECAEKQKEFAALRSKYEKLAAEYVDKYKKASTMKLDIEKYKMELKEVQSDLAELKADEPDQITQEMHKYYQQKVNCPMCNTRQRDAAFAKCYHLFCKECVDSVVQSKNRRCPTCDVRVSAKDAVRVYL